MNAIRLSSQLLFMLCLAQFGCTKSVVTKTQNKATSQASSEKEQMAMALKKKDVFASTTQRAGISGMTGRTSRIHLTNTSKVKRNLGTLAIKLLALSNKKNHTEIHRVVDSKQQRDRFLYCYDRAFQKVSPKSGDVQLLLVIKGNGRVRNATVTKSTMGHKKVEDCLSRTARYMRFTNVQGSSTTVEYFLRFEPQ